MQGRWSSNDRRSRSSVPRPKSNSTKSTLNPDNDRTSLEAQLGQTLDHQFTPRISFKEQLFFFPNLSEGGEYRINFDAALVMDINRRLAWQVTLSDRYLSDPPGGFKQNDLLLTTGLKIKLGLLK